MTARPGWRMCFPKVSGRMLTAGARTGQHQRASAVVVLAGGRSDFVGLRNGKRGAVSLPDCFQPASAARLLSDIRVGQITTNVDLWKSTILGDNILYRLIRDLS